MKEEGDASSSGKIFDIFMTLYVVGYDCSIVGSRYHGPCLYLAFDFSGVAAFVG